MPGRKQVATALAGLLAALTGGVWFVQPHLREHAFYATAVAALRSASVGVANLDTSPTSGPTIFLVVGSDRRHGRSGSVRDIRGERADAVVLWSVGEDGRAVGVSLPRDVRVHVPGHGDEKLGGTLDYGPAAVVDGVRSVTGIPIQHYVQLEFSALTVLVDQVGGIGIDLPRPVRDLRSGLSLSAGHHDLTGREALAYIRSRNYEELQGNSWIPDPSGDLGRIARQQQLLLRAFGRMSHCGILACLRVVPELDGSVTVDDEFDAAALRRLLSPAVDGDATIRTYVLPTSPERGAADSVSPFPPTHVGNVGYRRIEEPAAGAVLRHLLTPGTERQDER